MEKLKILDILVVDETPGLYIESKNTFIKKVIEYLETGDKSGGDEISGTDRHNLVLLMMSIDIYSLKASSYFRNKNRVLEGVRVGNKSRLTLTLTELDSSVIVYHLNSLSYAAKELVKSFRYKHC